MVRELEARQRAGGAQEVRHEEGKEGRWCGRHR